MQLCAIFIISYASSPMLTFLAALFSAMMDFNHF